MVSKVVISDVSFPVNSSTGLSISNIASSSMSILVPGDPYFVNNYPIYENDSKRNASAITTN